MKEPNSCHPKSLDHPMSDDKYLNALLSGNEPLIKEIYDRIFPKVKSFVSKNKGQVDDAYDIFQDALIYIITVQKKKKTEIKSFEAYLFVICKNLWRRKLKKRVIKIESNTLEDKTTDLNLFIFEQKCHDFYIEMFNQLSTNCKDIIGNYFNGWSYEEIQKEYDYSSVNTVRQRVFKCRTKLTQLIKNDKRYHKLKRWTEI